MKKIRIISVVLYSVSVFIIPLSTSCTQKGLKLDINPKDVVEKMVKNPAFIKNAKGESFCWNARVGMDQYVDNYKLTKDKEWLDAGEKYYDFLIARMDIDPDGYKGWIGPYEYDTTKIQDALVGDAILLTGILDFSVLVMEDPALKKIYGEKASSYVEIAKKDFVEKWDKRGCWYDDVPYGSYIGFSKYLKTGNLKEWEFAPEVSRSGISHPFNKQMDAAQVCLRLFRITGDKFYRDRAEKIFFTAKSHFQYFDNHYCWNYWEPLAPGDVDLAKNNTRHWVGVHPWKSGYQAGEAGKIAEAYHYGVVFDEQDLKRIINTNLNVMWNKDKANPKYISSNGLGGDNDTVGFGAYTAVNGKKAPIPKNTGELWTGLLDFDQTIRDLYEIRFKNDQKSARYLRYKNEFLANPPSFKRKLVDGEVKVPLINFTECKDLYLATVLPHIVSKDGKSIIICKSWNPGDLQIDLYSESGEKLLNLFKGKIDKELCIIAWDGKDPAKKITLKGDYKIRWTIGTGYREFPVVVN